jgi:hypothetical protein
MSNTQLMSLVAILAIAAVMIAAATVIPTHDAFAKKKRYHGHVVVAKTGDVTTVQAADNSQHVSNGAGSIGNTNTNAPINSQSQTANVGSTATG